MRAFTLPLLGLLLAAGCTPASDDPGPTGFVVWNTPHGVAISSPLLADGNLLAYLASEASSGNTKLNPDNDTLDAVAVRVNTATRTVNMLGVATVAMAFLNGTLFLVVDETADETQWNPDGDTDDLVLLYVPSASATPVYLADLDRSASPAMAVVDSRLVFVGPAITAPGDGATNLHSLSVPVAGGAPDLEIPILSGIDDQNDDGVSMSILGVVDGMLFLTMDETVDGKLNGDGDELDTAVLALIDAGDAAATVESTGLAVDAGGAVEALRSGNDWTIAFLVKEADEGVNLNDPSLHPNGWQPANCIGVEDADMTDHVLHWLLYSDFLSTGNVVNTGLVGRVGATEYVYVLDGQPKTFVGVVSYEEDEGSGAGCNLNDDLDFDDRIFRWVDASIPAPALPETDESMLLAVAQNVPGFNGDSTGGVIPLGALWVMLVDEAADGRDHDLDGEANRLVAAFDPSAGGSWNFDHGSSNAGPVSVSWMARNPRNPNQFLAALTEDVLDADLNGDGDKADSVPTFPKRFSGSRLTFPGFAIAVKPDDAGVTIAAGFGFYRVSEAAQGSKDFNGDGDANDFVLHTVNITSGASAQFLGTHNSQFVPAIRTATVGPLSFGAFLYQENQVGDLNGDGDASDFVVRYFRF